MSQPRVVRVGLVQLRLEEDREANLTAAEQGVREAAAGGAAVVCLPELFATRYFCQVEDAAHFDLAEPVPGPTSERFEALARELDVTLVVSLFERRAAGLYHNTAAVLAAGRGYLGKYRKMHIPDDPRYYEKFYFTPGDLGFRSFDAGPARLGVLVCWDQWYPEAARLTALRGAEILFYPTAIGWHPEERRELGEQQHAAWELVQRAHGVANGCFIVAVNRVGFEPDPSATTAAGGIHFWGQSFVAAPDGTVVYRGPEDAAAVAVVDIDLASITEMRTGWPFLRDRRIDAYDDLTKRYLDD